MKIKSVLVSALETLGKAYTNSRKKDEPAPCILQVLKLLKGSEDLDIENLLRKVAEEAGHQPKARRLGRLTSMNTSKCSQQRKATASSWQLLLF